MRSGPGPRSGKKTVDRSINRFSLEEDGSSSECDPTQIDTGIEISDDEPPPARPPAARAAPAPRPRRPPARARQAPRAPPTAAVPNLAPPRPPMYPEKCFGTGVTNFTTWFLRHAERLKHVDEPLASLPEPDRTLQTSLMSGAIHPLDHLFNMGHLDRGRVLENWIETTVGKHGQELDHANFKEYLAHISRYVWHAQLQNEPRNKELGEWAFRRSRMYQPLLDAEKRLKIKQAGSKGVGIDLAGADGDDLVESIMDATRHNASTIWPEHVEIFRMFWRGWAIRMEESGYKVKFREMPIRCLSTVTASSRALASETTRKNACARVRYIRESDLRVSARVHSRPSPS